ncbi:MAG: 2'-5' RNA ligase family protein [Clostridium sp.]
MYLVSLYFDDVSSKKLQGFINKAAVKSGNKFMVDNKVPPHITIASFQTKEEENIIKVLNKKIKDFESRSIMWASIGVFKSSVLFLAPVLNGYLHDLCKDINEVISSVENTSISRYYMPFQWMPHTTIAKKLTREELFLAFEELEKNFNIFSGKVTKIGLSKTNPYENIVVWELKNKEF